MKKAIFACLLLALTTGVAAAQTFPFNEAGVTNGHWHLNSKDVAANEKLFVGMGGKAFEAGGLNRVMFPGVVVTLHQAPGTPLPNGPTVGSVVNHVGFEMAASTRPM